MRTRLVFTLVFLWLLAGCSQDVDLTKSLPSPRPTDAPTQVLSPVALPTPVTSPSPVPRPTSSPIPSATPQPTATPVIYVIEEGDTLLGVAARYGISLDAIQLANPELRPELLQIGQQVIIPPLTDDNQAPGLLPVLTSIPLTIGNTGWYTTPTGGIWFVGEVVNDTDSGVENVRLGVTVYGHDGKVAAKADGWAAADVLEAGGKAPFGMLFGPEAADMTTYDTYLLTSEPVTRDGFWHPDLVIAESTGVLEDQVYRLRGIVRNDGDMEADQVTLVATLYDANGRITGFLQKRLDEPLPAGRETSFELWLAPVGPGSEQHWVTVSGRLPQETG